MKSSKLILSSFFFMMALLSCSVKEDRGECPCYLQLVPNEGRKMAESGGFLVHVYNDEHSVEVLDSIPWKSFAKNNYETPIARGRKTVCCISGVSAQIAEGELLLIEHGHQADSIFACSEMLDAIRETVSSRVVSNKQYTNVFMKYKGSGDSGFPYCFVLRGNVCGINMRTLQPVPGAFEYRTGVPDKLDIIRFRLPRQMDASLMLDIYDKDDGKLIDSYAVGESIVDSGFDWTAADLDDIYIGIDKYPNTITVTVLDWEYAGAYEELI